MNYDQVISEIQGMRADFEELEAMQQREQTVREAVAKIEASGILSDMELSAIKWECGV